MDETSFLERGIEEPPTPLGERTDSIGYGMDEILEEALGSADAVRYVLSNVTLLSVDMAEDSSSDHALEVQTDLQILRFWLETEEPAEHSEASDSYWLDDALQDPQLTAYILGSLHLVTEEVARKIGRASGSKLPKSVGSLSFGGKTIEVWEERQVNGTWSDGPSQASDTSDVPKRIDDSWINRAACHDTPELLRDVFYPPPEFEKKADKLAREERAKAVCATCVVREQCLNAALARKEQEGVWGGLTADERRELSSPDTEQEALVEDTDDQPRGFRELLLGLPPPESIILPNGKGLWRPQIEAVKASEEAIAAGQTRISVEMATGLGKTTVAAVLALRRLEVDPDMRVLYLTHRNRLGFQGRERFEEIVGNRSTYGTLTGEIKKDLDERFIFASLQTMEEWREYYGPNAFRLGMVDESHHGPAPSYEPIIDFFNFETLFAMTGTPYRSDMVDLVEMYGPLVYSKTLAQALADEDNKALARPNYRVMVDPNEAELWLRSDLDEGRINRGSLIIPQREEQRIQKLLEGIRQDGVKNPKILAYANSIQHANYLAARLPNAEAWHSENKGAIDRFEKDGAVSTLVTVGMADEGVDLPWVNVLAFFGQIGSEILFKQRIGRGARRIEGVKEEFWIYDLSNNYENVFHADRLITEIAAASGRRPNRYRSPTKNAEIIELDGATFEFTTRVVDVVERIKELEARRQLSIGTLSLTAFADELAVAHGITHGRLRRFISQEAEIVKTGRVKRILPDDQEKVKQKLQGFIDTYGLWRVRLELGGKTPRYTK